MRPSEEEDGKMCWFPNFIDRKSRPAHELLGKMSKGQGKLEALLLSQFLKTACSRTLVICLFFFATTIREDDRIDCLQIESQIKVNHSFLNMSL